MGEVINLGTRTKDDYFTILREREFDELVTIGIMKDSDGFNSYQIIPSHTMDAERLLGILTISKSTVQFGDEVD